MDLDKSIYIYIYSIYIPGYIPGYIYKIYVPGYIYLGYIYHLYIRYIPGHIYQDIYIWGFSPNKNTLEPLRDGINLSIKVPKGALIWHSTVSNIRNSRNSESTVSGYPAGIQDLSQDFSGCSRCRRV